MTHQEDDAGGTSKTVFAGVIAGLCAIPLLCVALSFSAPSSDEPSPTETAALTPDYDHSHTVFDDAAWNVVSVSQDEAGAWTVVYLDGDGVARSRSFDAGDLSVVNTTGEGVLEEKTARTYTGRGDGSRIPILSDFADILSSLFEGETEERPVVLLDTEVTYTLTFPVDQITVKGSHE